MSRFFSNLFFCAALFCLPWVGVGSFELAGLPSLGMGIQPAVLLSLLALLCSATTLWRRFVEFQGALPLSALLVFLFIGISSTWTMDHSGLFGEEPWSKSAKQALQFLLYTLMALTPVLILRDENRRGQLLAWERALTLGLLVSAAYGLLQALAFFRPMDFVGTVDGWVSSNPSIAAGSHELYLGHRFVGIPRIRSTACEPLYFGSYLLIAMPIAMGVAIRWSRGWGRAWRFAAALAGGVCFVMTFSRAAYGAAFFGLLVGAVFWLRAGRPRLAGRRSLIASGCAALIVALAVSALSGAAPWEIPTLLFRRAQQTLVGDDMSNLTRFFAWEAGWNAFRQRPLVGHGWGSFGFLYYAASPEGGAGAHFGWPVVNSIPLRILAELGLAGAVLCAWFFAPVAGGLRRLWLSPKAVEIGGFLSILWVVAAFHGLTHSQLQLPHLWFLAAICASQARFRMVVV